MKARTWLRIMPALLPAMLPLALLSACATRGTEEPEFETGFTPIRSETLFSARYYDSDETLVIVRRSGDVFEYHGVPKALADQLLAAEDRDAFYRDHLEGRFGEIKVEFGAASPKESDSPARGETNPMLPANKSE